MANMALIYDAVLNPSKIELLRDWLQHQPWAGEGASEAERVDSYRFDDPAGEVGTEVFLVKTGAGALLQVPVTYRGAPLAGGEAALLGTMEHSVLGTRYVYDAVADPVAVAAFIETIAMGGSGARMYLVEANEQTLMEQTSNVSGSGVADEGIVEHQAHALTPTTEAGVGFVTMDCTIGEQRRVLTLTLAVRRNLDMDDEVPVDPALALTGTWDGEETPQLLAWIEEAPETD